EYGVKLVSWDELPKASALVAAVAHDEYREMGTARLLERLAPGGVFVDVKGTHDRATIEAAGRYVWRL
ncbi:MAG: nucleotide sugar dehydrogenase, partial [Piscinibacter sp.]